VEEGFDEQELELKSRKTKKINKQAPRVAG